MWSFHCVMWERSVRQTASSVRKRCNYWCIRAGAHPWRMTTLPVYIDIIYTRSLTSNIDSPGLTSHVIISPPAHGGQEGLFEFCIFFVCSVLPVFPFFYLALQYYHKLSQVRPLTNLLIFTVLILHISFTVNSSKSIWGPWASSIHVFLIVCHCEVSNAPLFLYWYHGLAWEWRYSKL